MPHTLVERELRYLVLWAPLIFRSVVSDSTYTWMQSTRAQLRQIYGAFARTHLFLWLHLSWMIILSGVTVCYLAQNSLVLTGGPTAAGQRVSVSTNRCNTFSRGAATDGVGDTPIRSVECFPPTMPVIDAVERLRLGGLLVQVTESEHREIMPAKPLDRVTSVS